MIPDPSLVVRQVEVGDIPAIVDLQIATLSVSFLTRLGATFLTRFHRLLLAHDSTLALVATDTSGAVAGFAIATADALQLNAHLRWRLAPSLLSALLRRPSSIAPLARFPFEQGPQDEVDAELLLLAVDPSRRRLGIGATLVSRIEAELSKRGRHTYQVAVRSQLSEAREFYSNEGFVFDHQRHVFGEPMTYFTKKLVS